MKSKFTQTKIYLQGYSSNKLHSLIGKTYFNLLTKLGAKVGAVLLILFITASVIQAATITSTATGGTWNLGTTWQGGTAPSTTDNAIIATTGTGVVTLSGNATCVNLTLNTGSTLSVNTFQFTINGTVTNAGAITVSTGRIDLSGGSGDFTNSGTITYTGNGTLRFGGNFLNTGTNSLGSAEVRFYGTATITSSGFTTTGPIDNRKTAGSVTFTGNVSGDDLLISTTGSTVNLGVGLTHSCAVLSVTAGTLNCGSSTLNTTGNAVTGGTFTAGTGTINYSGAAQTAGVWTYNNLTLSGSGAKTFATTPTVNGILSLEGTATVVVTTGVVTYGAGATLQYNTSTARTSTTEEWITPFTATGGVIIANTGAITMDGAKVFNASVPLTVNSGSSLSMSTFLLTLSGNLVNSGGTVSGTTGGVTIAGAVTQSIGAFTTTGTVSMTKTGGTATLTGNVGGGAFTLNGTGGTLNLGLGLAHTFSGIFTRTAGILNLSSSTLNIDGSTSGTGGTWTQGTSTVDYGGGAQNLFAVAYNNLTLSGTGVKSFAAATTIDANLSISSGVSANLGTYASTSSTLTLGGVSQATGLYGGTGSGAPNINTTYFAAASGTLQVGAACTPGNWIGATSSDWGTASNWCNSALPTSSTNVVIPSGGTQPVIGGAALCNNLTINSSASLTITGSNTLTISGNVTNSGTFTPSTGTVIYNSNSAQTIVPVTYNNLTLSGTGAKTFPTGTTTVNGILSIENGSTANTFTGSLSYGTNATLQYSTSSARTAGNEWVTPFTATGGVIISGTGLITMDGAKVFNTSVPLTVNSGSSLSMSTFLLTLSGNLVNNGGTASGSGGVTITGTATQSIGAFTTTGTVSMTKTGGTATLTGNVSGGAFTLNGTGGTLNLGLGLAHTFSGIFTRTAGILNLSSSTLNIDGSTSGTGGTWTQGTSTVDYGGTAQNLFAVAYNNLTLSGSGVKSFAAATTIDANLSISSGVSANLGTYASTSSTLTLGGVSQATGLYGGTGSGAPNINTTYFAATSGTLQVGAACTPGNWIGATSSDWGTASNWCNSALPTSSTNVVIPSGGTQPVIGGAALCNNLTINSSASLSISGSNSLTISGNVTNNGTFTPNTGTVIYNSNSAQTIVAVTYNNLTLSGTGAKTFPSGTTTVNGILSIENGSTANTFTGSLSYGTNATLQYNTSSARTASTEWVTPFTATGGVIISGTGLITMNEAKVFNASVPLTVNSGSSLSMSTFLLTLSGNLVNSGGTVSGTTGGVTIAGAVTQSIGAFTTTGTVSMTKTGGTATLTGNVGGVAFTLNGSGGTLNLGSGLTHTFSGAFTRTAGTLNLGSSTLNIDGATSGTGGTWTQGTSTVDYGGTAQNLFAVAYNNLTLSGSGVKSFAAATTIDANLSISSGVSANLGTYASTSSTLTLGGVSQATGLYGGTGSGAPNINTTYFAATSGTLQVGAACTPGNWIGATSSDWGTASNWCNSALPTSSTNVVIPSGGTQPVIGGAALCNNLTINSSASLSISGSNSLTISGNVTNNGTFTTNTGTVIYNSNSAQTIVAVTYNNLTLSGTGAKTFPSGTTTVNGILSIENGSTANTFTGSLSYGTNATLQYNTSSARTASTEWVTPFTATGGVIISGTGLITMNEAKVFNASVPLTVNSGSSLSMSTFLLTLSGNLVNSGGTVSGTTGGVTIAGAVTQSIGAFTTTGTVSMTKTGGTATLTGNVSGVAFTLNGSGGTLNLGSGLTHTFSGAFTRTAGTLNLGSSTLNIDGATSGTGGTWTQGTSTVDYGGTAQNLFAVAYNNLTLSGSGVKSFAAATTIDANLSISSGVSANLGTFTSSSNTLTLGGTTQAIGSYGGTGSGATNINTTFFAAATGILNVGGCIPGTWTGASSNVWNLAANWCDLAIPGASTDVIIPSGVTQPVIGAAALCRNLNINSGATLTSGAFTLTVSGNFTNNGTFTAGTGTIILNGTGTQTIGGTTASTFNNLTVNKASGGVTLGANETVSGVLTLTSGILTSTSSTLLSVTNTAAGAISGGSPASFIYGPVRWTLPTLATGTTYVFPVGKAAYLPFSLVNPTTTGTVTAQVEAFSGSSGGTFDPTLTALSLTEYWSLVTGGAAFTSSSVSLTRQLLITPLDAIGGSTTSAGTYTSLAGTAGTNGVTVSTLIGANRFFLLARRALGTFNSVTPGGSWNSAATWDQLLVPPLGSNVVISAVGPVTVTTATGAMLNVTVNGLLDAGTSVVSGTGTFSMASTGTLFVGGTNNFPSGFATYSLSSGSSVNYENTGNQTIAAVTYGNLLLSNSGVKTLPGTALTVNGNLTVSGTSTITPTVTLNVSGTTTLTGSAMLTLGAANVLSGAVTLDGGTFRTGAGAGYSETVGALTVPVASTIALGTGNHTLTFANSSSYVWNGVSLTINGWTGTPGVSGTAGKISFGSAAGLTAVQLAKVIFTGFPGTHAVLLSSGEMVPATSPNLVITGVTEHGGSCIGTPATPVTYTITNTGGAATGVTVTSDNAQFVVSAAPIAVAGSGGTATYVVTFTPTAGGIQSANITVASTTSGSNSPVSILTGTGTVVTAGLTSSDPDNIICAGDAVTFTATGGTLYEFFVDAVSQGAAASTATFVTSLLTNGQIVTVRVTNAGGCFATSTGITTTVNARPPTPEISGNPSVAVGGITLFGSTTGGGTWSSSDPTQATVDPLSGLVTGISAGTPTLRYTVTNINGCASFTEVVLIVTGGTGIDDLKDNSGLLLRNHPNPFSGNTTITYTLPTDGHVTLTIRNLAGQKVQTVIDEMESKGDYTQIIPAGDMKSGVYFGTLSLKSNGKEVVKTIRLVKGQ